MLRRLHIFIALSAAVLVTLMAITGTLLSLDPAVEVMSTASAPARSEAVAELAAAVADRYPSVERIERTASGSFIVHFVDEAGDPAAAYVDPKTGAEIGTYEPSPVFGFIAELHRSLFLGDGGRVVTGIASLALVLLSVSGVAMLARRMGGWKRLFRPGRGVGPQRLHVGAGRLAAPGLMLSAATGLYMSLVALGFIGDGSDAFLAFPAEVDGGQPAAFAELSALREAGVADLRELVFPVPDDPSDVFTLTTASGQGYVDQATGALLDYTPNGVAQSLYELIFKLHTGQGTWWLGLMLGLAALAAPALAASGVLVWWRRRRELPRLSKNSTAQEADTVILVGSEGGTTWGFAAALHEALVAAGRRVHSAPMNRLAANYPSADKMLVLTATHGNGGPPASATHFVARLAKYRGEHRPAFAILAFGDRSFPQFCRYAADVEAALLGAGWRSFQPLETIDRQSSQTFARWADETGALLGIPLRLDHVAQAPATAHLGLVSRQDYGLEVQAPTAVLRFGIPGGRPGWLAGLLHRRFPRFAPGDLLGVVPPGSIIPRYYSIASLTRDGFVEICVRKQPGGRCSEFLHALQPGDRIDAFVRANPHFRPDRRRSPLILVGAGTGIAPLVGFIRNNAGRRPVYLYWGGRHPGSDFLYESTLKACLADSRLTGLATAFSRVAGGRHVQDQIAADAESVRALLRRGAQVLVCGGKDMARGVSTVIDAILLTPGGVDSLRSAGRYLEDVY